MPRIFEDGIITIIKRYPGASYQEIADRMCIPANLVEEISVRLLQEKGKARIYYDLHDDLESYTFGYVNTAEGDE